MLINGHLGPAENNEILVSRIFLKKIKNTKFKVLEENSEDEDKL